eukprot:jgi/Tetstr1/432279/TSEL_002313.t1
MGRCQTGSVSTASSPLRSSRVWPRAAYQPFSPKTSASPASPPPAGRSSSPAPPGGREDVPSDGEAWRLEEVPLVEAAAFHPVVELERGRGGQSSGGNRVAAMALMSLVAVPELGGWSVEELRMRAYDADPPHRPQVNFPGSSGLAAFGAPFAVATMTPRSGEGEDRHGGVCHEEPLPPRPTAHTASFRAGAISSKRAMPAQQREQPGGQSGYGRRGGRGSSGASQPSEESWESEAAREESVTPEKRGGVRPGPTRRAVKTELFKEHVKDLLQDDTTASRGGLPPGSHGTWDASDGDAAELDGLRSYLPRTALTAPVPVPARGASPRPAALHSSQCPHRTSSGSEQRRRDPEPGEGRQEADAAKWIAAQLPHCAEFTKLLQEAMRSQTRQLALERDRALEQRDEAEQRAVAARMDAEAAQEEAADQRRWAEEQAAAAAARLAAVEADRDSMQEALERLTAEQGATAAVRRALKEEIHDALEASAAAEEESRQLALRVRELELELEQGQLAQGRLRSELAAARNEAQQGLSLKKQLAASVLHALDLSGSTSQQMGFHWEGEQRQQQQAVA